MKKKLLLLITLVVSLFIYNGRVNASQVMYMECDDGFSDFLGMFTEGENNVKFEIIKRAEDSIPGGSFNYERDKCWIREARFLDENCSDDEFGEKRDYDINSGMCPEKIRMVKQSWYDPLNLKSSLDRKVLFAGELINPKENSISIIEKSQYIFFRRKSDDKVFAESYYSENGIYSHIGGGPNDARYLIITHYSDKYDKNFWMLTDDISRTQTYIDCGYDKNCNFERDYDILFDSGSKKNELEKKVNEWMEDNKINLSNGDYNKFLSIVNDSKFLYAVDKMNESYEKSESYDFNNGYSAVQMYNKLNDSYNYLKSIYDNPIRFKDYNDSGKYLTDCVESALQFTALKFTGKVSFDEYCEIDDNECLNVPFLYKALYDDVREYINSKNNYSTSGITVLDLGNLGKLDEYTSKFLTAIAYLNKYSDSTDLDITIKENGLPKLKDNMADLGRTRDIYVVIDCDDLFSDEVKNKINHYYNIFKILISLLLIVFGLLDFGKAIFESDDKKMKESQSKFFKRIIIVIILFLVPLFVKFILSIANAVWSNIYPGACGLF